MYLILWCDEEKLFVIVIFIGSKLGRIIYIDTVRLINGQKYRRLYEKKFSHDDVRYYF